MTTQIDTGTPALLAQHDAGVLTLTMNRPQARNAMSRPMMMAMQ
jgi:2-(1,2-epoxy-1,2-dihydrophenyl)acetyl-CoA isomerase